MANSLTANLAELFKKLQGPDGSVIYKDPNIQEMYKQFLVGQGKKLETPRISTAPESLENFQKAGRGQVDLTRGYNRALEEHGHNMWPLKEKGSHLRTDEYGRNLAHQVAAFQETQAGALDHARQVQYDRTHTTMPALIALQKQEIENANTDALLGRLLQGLGTAAILVS